MITAMNKEKLSERDKLIEKHKEDLMLLSVKEMYEDVTKVKVDKVIKCFGISVYYECSFQEAQEIKNSLKHFIQDNYTIVFACGEPKITKSPYVVSFCRTPYFNNTIQFKVKIKEDVHDISIKITHGYEWRCRRLGLYQEPHKNYECNYDKMSSKEFDKSDEELWKAVKNGWKKTYSVRYFSPDGYPYTLKYYGGKIVVFAGEETNVEDFINSIFQYAP
jgi:hypothetical protein